jgi:cytochrome c peroxidase
MDGDWPTILERLNADEEVVRGFTEAYGEDGLTQDNVLDAIVQYESYLVTPAAFDRWMRGDEDAMTEQQQRGLRTFVETGCTSCHRGRNIGGTMYQRMGLVHDYFARRGGEVTEADLGRFNVTGEEGDRHKFKVPTLRNVTRTAPYFHDGSEQELAGAVRTMAYVQLDQELSDEQVADIVAFLGALEGELPADAGPPGQGDDEAGGEAARAPARRRRRRRARTPPRRRRATRSRRLLDALRHGGRRWLTPRPPRVFSGRAAPRRRPRAERAHSRARKRTSTSS